MKTLRFFLFNLVGNVFPLLVALAAMPVVAALAGVERLGVLAVVWTLVGYFGFLDFGLSRVVTRRLAQAVEQGRVADELGALRGFFYWVLLPSLLLLALLFLAARPLLAGFFHGGALSRELAGGWAWVALALPATLAANWLRGALEGLQRFARVNLLRLVFGAWTYGAPALVALRWPTLDAMVCAVAVGRVLSLVAHFIACGQVERGIVLGAARRDWGHATRFVREGGWMSVSNLVSPMMVYFDRFVLAALVPPAAVAWYATSQEALLGARLIPGALAGVLFPQFAAASGDAGDAHAVKLYRLGIRSVAALMLPVCVLAATFAYDGMSLWMGESFAANSHRIVAIIAIGLYANSIAQLPFAWLQGVGRSKVTAQIHLAELPLYAVGVTLCVTSWGIEGAAWMWTARIVADCLLLLRMARPAGGQTDWMVALSGCALIAALGMACGPQWPPQWRLALGGLALAASLLLAWFCLLNKQDRAGVLRFRYAH